MPATNTPAETLLSSMLQSIRKVRADLDTLEDQYDQLKAVLMPPADVKEDSEDWDWETPEEKTQRIASQADEVERDEDGEPLWFTPPPTTKPKTCPVPVDDDGEDWA